MQKCTDNKWFHFQILQYQRVFKRKLEKFRCFVLNFLDVISKSKKELIIKYFNPINVYIAIIFSLLYTGVNLTVPYYMEFVLS